MISNLFLDHHLQGSKLPTQHLPLATISWAYSVCVLCFSFINGYFLIRSTLPSKVFGIKSYYKRFFFMNVYMNHVLEKDLILMQGLIEDTILD